MTAENRIVSLEASSTGNQVQPIQQQNVAQLIANLINGRLSVNILTSIFFFSKGKEYIINCLDFSKCLVSMSTQVIGIVKSLSLHDFTVFLSLVPELMKRISTLSRFN